MLLTLHMLRNLSPVTDDEPTTEDDVGFDVEDDVEDDDADWRFPPRRAVGRRGPGRDTWGNSGP
jgi:hypothetical protein